MRSYSFGGMTLQDNSTIVKINKNMCWRSNDKPNMFAIQIEATVTGSSKLYPMSLGCNWIALPLINISHNFNNE